MTAEPHAAAAPPRARGLHGLDPLAKVAATLPAMAVVLVSRDVVVPAVALGVALVVLLAGARPERRIVAALLMLMPLVVAIASVSLGIWVDASRVPTSPTIAMPFGRPFTVAMWVVGLATALRIAAILVLSLLCGLTTSGPDLVRALVQHLRVPYRLGWTALAAARFVPRFQHELDVIRAAHRIRGMAGGRGPIAAARRWMGYGVPLLVGALRHSSRVALAMDARAFGAAPTRTERHPLRWRRRDAVAIGLGLVLAVALAALALRCAATR